MLPCQRKTLTQSKMRRSHNALKAINSTRCPNCGDVKLPHRACGACGFVRKGLSLTPSSKEA